MFQQDSATALRAAHVQQLNCCVKKQHHHHHRRHHVRLFEVDKRN